MQEWVGKLTINPRIIPRRLLGKRLSTGISQDCPATGFVARFSKESPCKSLFVVVLVQKDNQLLLIQEAKGEKAWSLPGGQVWPGETLIQAAQREVREEAGIKIVPQGLLKIDHCVPKRKDSPEWWRFVLTAKARGGQLKTSPDPHSLQAQWFDLKNLRQMPLRSKDILKLTKLYQSGVY